MSRKRPRNRGLEENFSKKRASAFSTVEIVFFFIRKIVVIRVLFPEPVDAELFARFDPSEVFQMLNYHKRHAEGNDERGDRVVIHDGQNEGKDDGRFHRDDGDVMRE